MRSAKRVPSSLSVFGQYRIPLIRTEDDAWAEFAMVDGMQRRASGADADAAWAAGAPRLPDAPAVAVSEESLAIVSEESLAVVNDFQQKAIEERRRLRQSILSGGAPRTGAR